MPALDLTSNRLSNQKLTGSKYSIRHILGHLAAMQAQDYYGSLWAVGLRTGLTEKEIIAALEKLEVIRTWPQRGTLHFVLPEDAAWMVGLSAPRLLAGAKRRHENLELDEKTLERSKELFAAALQGGVRLTRPAMLDLLENAGISTQGGRGYHMLWYAAQTGLIYIGPMEVKQQTFGLLTDLPVPPRNLSREEAVVNLAKRYFTSHGPATVQDLMWWSGLTAKDVKAALGALAGELVSTKTRSTEYWMGADAMPEDAVPDTLLLPGFDEYILGYKVRDAQLAPENFKRIVPGGNGMFMSSVVRHGRVVGTWKRTLKKEHAILDVEPFERLTSVDMDAIREAATAYERFLDLPCQVQFAS